MKLFLLRHTTAADSAPSDAARALTTTGQEEARLAGAGLATQGAAPKLIFASPLLRARQTAEIAARAMNFAGTVAILDELSNDHTTVELLHALKRHSTADEILLVGHMPSLAGHVAALIGADSDEDYAFGKGGAAYVDMAELRLGTGHLRWHYRLEQLRKVAAGRPAS